MLGSVEQDLVVDFVGNDRQVVADREIGKISSSFRV